MLDVFNCLPRLLHLLRKGTMIILISINVLHVLYIWLVPFLGKPCRTTYKTNQQMYIIHNPSVYDIHDSALVVVIISYEIAS